MATKIGQKDDLCEQRCVTSFCHASLWQKCAKKAPKRCQKGRKWGRKDKKTALAAKGDGLSLILRDDSEAIIVIKQFNT